MSSALLRLSKPPESGPKVRGLQERLKALGYDPGTIDGVFGPSTERAAVKGDGFGPRLIGRFRDNG